MGVQGGTESSLQGKSAHVPWVLPKDHKIEYMLDNNKKRVSVAETSSHYEDNITTLTPSARDTREIVAGPPPGNKVRGTQSQRILTNFFPHKNITYKNKVFLQEVYYYTYYVLVTDK